MNRGIEEAIKSLRALGAGEAEIEIRMRDAVTLAAANVRPDLTPIFARIAAIGRFQFDDFLLLRERGIEMPREVAEKLLENASRRVCVTCGTEVVRDWMMSSGWRHTDQRSPRGHNARVASVDRPDADNVYVIRICKACGHAPHGIGIVCGDSKRCGCRG